MLTLAELHCHSDLKARIQAEYLEMPGLRLTVPQAARLCKVDRETCLRLLASLVETGFLFQVWRFIPSHRLRPLLSQISAAGVPYQPHPGVN